MKRTLIYLACMAAAREGASQSGVSVFGQVDTLVCMPRPDPEPELGDAGRAVQDVEALERHIHENLQRLARGGRPGSTTGSTW